MEKFYTIKEEREFKKQTLSEKAKKWFSQKSYLKKGFAEKVEALRKTAASLLIMAVIGQFTVGIFSTTAAAGDPANLDGSLAVANTTTGGTYQEDSVQAKVDDVVKLELAYHNTEPPNSGTDAYNVLARIGLPQNTGTSLVAEGFVRGSNTNALTDTASVLTEIPATLSYVPGSAKWRHNIGTNDQPNWVTETISDNIVTIGVNLGTVKPCWNMQGTITVLVRVNGSVIDVQKQVAHLGGQWQEQIEVEPGDRVAYMIGFTNQGNVNITNTIIGDNLPGYMSYVAGSTKLYNANYPNGTDMPDGITTGGIRIGTYTVGSNGYVVFQADISNNVPAGCHSLRNVGIVDSDQTPETWDFAVVNVCREAAPPAFRISKAAFNVTQNVDATTTLARAGDVIRYSLSTSNSGEQAGSYNIQDDITDVLEYTNLTNNGGGTLNGNVINYGNTTIQPNQTVIRSFEIEVKPFVDWPNNGDLNLINIYGNQILIRLGYFNITQAKSAFNDTQRVDATTAVARAGDAITYTLITRNTGNDVATNYVVSDDISDVLEYVDVTGLNGGTLANEAISWTAQNIPAGGQIVNTFVVTVKNPISDNQQNGTSFDYRMDNVYGNEIRITVERPSILGGVIAGATAYRLATSGSSNWLVAVLALFMLSSSIYLYIREKKLLSMATMTRQINR